MIKKIVIVIFLVFSNKIDAQEGILDFKLECPNSKFNEVLKKPHTLVVVSSSLCSYCSTSLKNLKELTTFENIEIIIFEYEYSKSYENQKKYPDYIFIDANKCNKSKYSDDFFPMFYLYKEGKLIWEREGWYSNNIKKIKKATNNI